MAKKRVLIPIANGSDEIETTCIAATLNHFGAEVVTASVMQTDDHQCVMHRGINIIADVNISAPFSEPWDLIALPGGPGAEKLRDSTRLISMLKGQKEKGLLLGAIGSAPALVLASKQLVDRGATCYPSEMCLDYMQDINSDDVVVQGNVVTSQGPGTALKFALKLGEILYGEARAKEVAKELLIDRPIGGRMLRSTVLTSPVTQEVEVTPTKSWTTPERKSPRGRAMVTDVSPAEKTKNRGRNTKAKTASPKVVNGITRGQFYVHLWPALENRGWKLEHGTRACDTYYLPPGVNRGPPFQNRKDFFDSAKQVINCISNDSKWKSDAALQEIVMDFENKVPSIPIATTPKASSTRAKRQTPQKKEQPAKKTKSAPHDGPEEKIDGSKHKKHSESGPEPMKTDYEKNAITATSEEESGKGASSVVEVDLDMPDATIRTHQVSTQPSTSVTTAKNNFEFDNDRFLSDIWPELEIIGWKKEEENHGSVTYFLPPGVHRTDRYKERIDYFEGASQCYNAIKNGARFYSHPAIKAAVLKFECKEVSADL